MEDNNRLVQTNKREISLKGRYEGLFPETIKRIENFLSIYGEDFFSACREHFPSSNREALYPTIKSAVEAHTPSMTLFDKMYGEGASAKWLEVQITEVLMFTGLRDKMSQYQRMALANKILEQGKEYQLTVSEWMQFFVQFEMGCYKTFHGYERPNPQVITESVSRYLYDLRIARQVVYDEEERMRKKAQADYDRVNAVPCPDDIKESLDKKFSQGLVVSVNDALQTKDNRINTKYVVTHADGSQSQPMTLGQLSAHISGLEPDSYIINKTNN